MNLSSFTALLLILIAAVAGSYAGIAISGVPKLSRRVVPFSGVMLLLVSLMWVLPELAEDFGWAPGVALMTTGFLLLWLVDRFVYPVCPSCSHTHNHDTCVSRLHGFAGPLLMATVIHSLFDGWALAAAQTAGKQGISAGVLLHKVPESIAFGIILRAALKTRRSALVSAVLVQTVTLLGAGLESVAERHMGPFWIHVLLAIAGGTFLYLGFHAVHSEWRRRTMRAATHS